MREDTAAQENKKMMKRKAQKITPPKCFMRTEEDGTRSVLVKVDVMLERGTRFYATFRKWMSVEPDLVLGRYVFDMKDLENAVIDRYPSLRRKEFRLAF